MINYVMKYYDKLLTALFEHLQLVVISMFFSLCVISILLVFCIYFHALQNLLVSITSMLYSIPSLAMFAILIPLTGLGKTTAILVLVIYNQYLLLRNFLTGLREVDESIIEAATAMGMKKMQLLLLIQLPLSKKAIFAGIRIAIVSTIGIGTIAASINAGGLGTILFDGLRTLNTNKIIIGSILSASLAIIAHYGLRGIEVKLDKKFSESK